MGVSQLFILIHSFIFFSSKIILSYEFLIEMDVNHEVSLLQEEIKRLGTKDETTGEYVVEFGVLFADDKCANLFEALVGTLRAAKRKKIITYEGELLLQGVHDKVPIKLLST